MLRFHSPFDGKRYIGDHRLRVFHDSLHEELEPGLDRCRIDRIPDEEIRIFSPDTPAEAWRRGFVQCPYCRGEENGVHELEE